MQDRPSKRELLAAVANLLRDDVMPVLEGHLRFQVRVAVNLLGILDREIDLGARHHGEDLDGFVGILGGKPEKSDIDEIDLEARVRGITERLCDEIRHDAFNEPERRNELLKQLRNSVARKLAVANPKFLSRVDPPPEAKP